jgi:hypothetical protein
MVTEVIDSVIINDAEDVINVQENEDQLTVTETDDGVTVESSETDDIVITDLGDGESIEVSDSVDEVQNINDAPNVSITNIDGIGQLTSKPAGEDLGQGKIVAVSGNTFVLADNDVIAHVNAIVGITLSATLTGNTAQVLQIGKVTNNTWSWTPDQPLFVGSNGDMTQTPPATGFVQVVGVAVTATEINFEIKTPVVL